MCKLLNVAEFGYYIVFYMLIFLASQTVSEISIYDIILFWCITVHVHFNAS